MGNSEFAYLLSLKIGFGFWRKLRGRIDFVVGFSSNEREGALIQWRTNSRLNMSKINVNSFPSSFFFIFISFVNHRFWWESTFVVLSRQRFFEINSKWRKKGTSNNNSNNSNWKTQSNCIKTESSSRDYKQSSSLATRTSIQIQFIFKFK